MNAPLASQTARPAYRRSLHYVDSSIQGPLLLAMVGLEVVLVAASIWFAHRRLIHPIDDSMYRMSLSHAGPTLSRLAQERARFAAIRGQVEKLEAAASGAGSAQDLRDAVENLNKLLS